jgi:hypothetical protein
MRDLVAAPERGKSPADDSSNSEEVGDEAADRRRIVNNPPEHRVVRIATKVAFLTMPRQSASQKAEYEAECRSGPWLTRAQKYDCGCALHDIGCCKFVLAAAMARRDDGMKLLLRCRACRFETKHNAAFVGVRTEVCGFARTRDVKEGSIWFEFRMLEQRMCRAAYRYFYGYPDMTLRSVEMDADVGRVEAAWEVARLGEVVSDTRASDARVFAHEHVKSELCGLSEEQPNIAPYHDTAAGTDVRRFGTWTG